MRGSTGRLPNTTKSMPTSLRAADTACVTLRAFISERLAVSSPCGNRVLNLISAGGMAEHVEPT